MKSTPEDIRKTLEPFCQAIKDPVDFTQESLFVGRDALKQVFDMLDHRRQAAASEGFGAIQSLVGALLRKGSVDQVTALKAIDGLFQSIIGSMDEKPSETFHMGAMEEEATPAAAQYLRLATDHAGSPGQPSSTVPQSAGIPVPSGPSPASLTLGGPGANPATDPSLGQLLVVSGKISQGQLTRALDLQQINGRRLGEVLIAMEAIGIQSLEEALSRQQLLQTRRAN